MFVLMTTLGWFCAYWLIPGYEWGGIIAAIGLWGVLLTLSNTHGDELVLLGARAFEIDKQDAPTLWNCVEEMTIASGLGGRMPKVYIIEDSMPNAFAVGRKRSSAAIVVTSGLLARLDRDELQGVVAHEMAHIANKDVSFMVMCSVMVGTIVLLSEILLRLSFVGAIKNGRRSGGAKGHPAMAIVSFILALLAPLCARLIYFACSRRREYLADACAARYTRYPEGLASALEKIGGHTRSSGDPNRALAALYIYNPEDEGVALSDSFHTHPPLEKRIEILRSMGNAGYKEYDLAYQRVFGQGNRVVGARTLARDSKAVQIREASVDKAAETKKDAVERAHQAAEIVGRLTGLITMCCPCGVWIKVPQESNREAIPCPRCGQDNHLPGAVRPDGSGESCGHGDGAGEEHHAEPTPMTYSRRGEGWESFRCNCGKTVQISPALSAPKVRCRRCREDILLV